MRFNLTNLMGSKLLNIIIIFITFLVAINIFKSQVKNVQSLKRKKDEEIKKIEVLNNISQLEKISHTYKEIFGESKKDTSLVLNTISNIANKSAVKIISIKPSKQEDYPMYIKYSFDVIIGLNSYHALGQFISNLEGYADIYFVDRLSIKLAEKSKASGQVREESEQTYNLIVDLTLSTLALKGQI